MRRGMERRERSLSPNLSILIEGRSILNTFSESEMIRAVTQLLAFHERMEHLRWKKTENLLFGEMKIRRERDNTEREGYPRDTTKEWGKERRGKPF